jgi:DNA-binding ferritin-like protein (Dps family)
MNKRKLDSLLWENIPFENFIIVGCADIKQENLDDVFGDDVDELCVSRDDDYNINISCVRYLNQYKEKKQKPITQKKKLYRALLCQRAN